MLPVLYPLCATVVRSWAKAAGVLLLLLGALGAAAVLWPTAWLREMYVGFWRARAHRCGGPLGTALVWVALWLGMILSTLVGPAVMAGTPVRSTGWPCWRGLARV